MSAQGHTIDCPKFETHYPWLCDCRTVVPDSAKPALEPDHIHEQHGPDCSCPKCWPDGAGVFGALQDEVWSIIVTKDDETDKETTRKIMEAIRAAAIPGLAA